MTEPPFDDAERSAALRALGFMTRAEGDLVIGDAPITPEMWIPGTQVLRTSVLSIWADVAAGHLAVFTYHPRIPVTLDLDVHLYRQPVGTGWIEARASIVKAGRSIVVARVDLTLDGEPLGVAGCSFMVSPDPEHLAPGGFEVNTQGSRGHLEVPFAERVGATQAAPGVGEVPLRLGNMNAVGSIQGGLVGLAVEEALLSVAPGSVMTSLSLRYLRPYRVGPARATVELSDDLAVVRVTDGDDAKLSSTATARFQPAAA
jgi:acyl-coenzyme A thioesterase PaaI-like protein